MKTIENIWIIDDDSLYTLLLTKTLLKLKACNNISSFHNGEVAIDALKETIASGNPLPELIFLDINMSIMDGWEFIEEYKQLKSDKDMSTVIYIASSSISEDDMNKAKSLNEIHDYIVKPINVATLQNIIQRFYEQK